MTERELPDNRGVSRPGPGGAPGGNTPGPDARWGIPLIFLAVIAALWLSFRLVPDLGALVDDLPLLSDSATPTLTIAAVADSTPTPGVSRPQPSTPAPASNGQAAPASTARTTFVPNLLQSGQERAVESLKQHQLIAEIEEVFDDTVARGLVVSHAPEANTVVQVGSTVIIRISKGPENPTMPDVVGMTVDNAREQLGLLSVTIEELEQPNDTVAAGIVVAQEPPAGTQVEAESTVRIIVSTGVDRIPVPDVRNKYFAFAQQELAGSGLRGVKGIELTNDPGKCGTIASQNPEPGTPVPLNTSIYLNIRGGSGCTP